MTVHLLKLLFYNDLSDMIMMLITCTINVIIECGGATYMYINQDDLIALQLEVHMQ